jgi:hypothetical protein
MKLNYPINQMKLKNLTRITWALLPAALVTLTSCSSTSSPPAIESSSSTSFQQGVPGGVAVETRKLTATVTDIDAADRKVTLVTRDGKLTTVKCGPEVVNFDQIRIGDQLKVTVTQELVAYLADAGAPPSDDAGTAVVLAPRGAKPGGVLAETVQVTARVTKIDLKHHKATLRFPDGTAHTVAVRPDVDLTQRKVGEQVVIRTTGTVAISVEKP